MTAKAEHLQAATAAVPIYRHKGQPYNKFAAIATAIEIRQIYYNIILLLLQELKGNFLCIRRGSIAITMGFFSRCEVY